jgi:hypothetical protein
MTEAAQDLANVLTPEERALLKTLEDQAYLLPLLSVSGERKGTALIDPSDVEKVTRWRWTVIGKYAYRPEMVDGRLDHIYLHRFILDFPVGIVDHINRNPLDNRRTNLRIVTQAQNLMNRGKNKNNSSGYKGVYKHSNANVWVAEITKGRVKVRRACFPSAIQAAQAYDRWAREFHGEYACVNFSNEVSS